MAAAPFSKALFSLQISQFLHRRLGQSQEGRYCLGCGGWILFSIRRNMPPNKHTNDKNIRPLCPATNQPVATPIALMITQYKISANSIPPLSDIVSCNNLLWLTLL